MIETEYEWHFRGHSFELRKKWPSEKLEHLKSLRHEIRDPAQWDYFISREPYKEELIDFIVEVQEIMKTLSTVSYK